MPHEVSALCAEKASKKLSGGERGGELRRPREGDWQAGRVVVNYIIMTAIIPKAELHVHSDGVLDLRMLKDLATAGTALPISADEFATLCPVSDKGDWLSRYIPRIDPLLTPGDIWQARLVDRYIGRAFEQNISYLEIMVSGLLYIKDADKKRAVEAYQLLRREAARAAGGKVKVEFLAAIGRGPRERMEAQAERILALHAEKLICGVCIAGEESQCNIEDIKDLMARFKDTGMGIEIHAGEWRGPESVQDALDYGMPDRLGHAIAAFRDPALIDRIQQDDIHLEFCPTSNLVFGAVKRLEDHPIRQARNLGLNFSINTDDPGPLDCTLSDEFGIAERMFGFSQTDFETVFNNAMKSRFEGR